MIQTHELVCSRSGEVAGDSYCLCCLYRREKWPITPEKCFSNVKESCLHVMKFLSVAIFIDFFFSSVLKLSLSSYGEMIILVVIKLA